jgi:hypothetical protein
MPSVKKRSHRGYDKVATDDLDDIQENYGPEDVPVPKVLHDFDPKVRHRAQRLSAAPRPRPARLLSLWTRMPLQAAGLTCPTI